MAHKFGFSTSITEEDRQLEHLLHLVWALDEEGERDVEAIRKRWEHSSDVATLIERAEKDGMLVSTDGRLELTGMGRERTSEIVRRYRLAECLLSEVLLLNESQYEQSACEFEHILGPEVTDSVCTLLGHPPVCPHGRPIPRGACCERFGKEVQPLVVRISDLSPGDVGKIVFISSGRSRRLDKLSTMGIIPGTLLKLHQRKPSFIVDLGETQLAIDGEIAGEIYVKKMGCSYI
ncbi:metal-dependent transcriptional regulator [Gemmatimonadota bacterium]